MQKKKYQGYLLAANPSNPRDQLHQSVILLVTHNDSMAIGLQINNPLTELRLGQVAESVGIDLYSDEQVYYGGNISQNKIHVIHSTEWQGHTTVRLTSDLAVTSDTSILNALARGDGPEYYRACAGYWMWEDGRLDQQLDNSLKITKERHKWEILPAELTNVFDIDPDHHWQKVLEDSARFQVNSYFT